MLPLVLLSRCHHRFRHPLQIDVLLAYSIIRAYRVLLFFIDPAAAGDVVVGINGVSCKGMTAQQVSSQLLLSLLLMTNMLMIVVLAVPFIVQLAMPSMPSPRRAPHQCMCNLCALQVIEELKKVTDVIAVLDLMRAPPATL